MTDVMDDSIFAGLDADKINEIPTDPFYVAPGVYFAVCVESKVQEKDGKKALTLRWQIEEPTSDFNHNNLSEWFNIFSPDGNGNWDPDEKKSMSYMMRRLRRGFDVSESEVVSVKPAELLGREAYLTVVENSGKGANEGKKFTNVKDAISKRLYEEENPDGSRGAVSEDLGLGLG